jgi:hypothetical protein
MAIRVAHCGAGNMGKLGLKGVLHHPDLELVGLHVWSPEKVGADAGVLCGEAPAGVPATSDWQALLDLKPDCLSYFGDALEGRERQTIDDVLPFLERGVNVVSISAFAAAHPATTAPDIREPIEAACRKGGASMFFTGIDPGWATTDLAIAALAPADRVDCVRLLELGYWGHYTSEYSMREYFGFGKPKGFEPLLISRGSIRELWEPTLQQIAEVLGVTIEGWELTWDTDVVDHDVETGIGVIAAGTNVVIRFELAAMAGGKPIAIVEHVDSIARDAGKQWKQPHGPYDLVHRVEIEGDPAFGVEIGYGPGSAGKCTVMPVINAIPAVCAARPGLLGPLDVPRYWARNVRPVR